MISITFGNIATELDKLEVAFAAANDKSLAAAANRLLAHLESATPIDTGFARQSWSLRHLKQGKVVIENTAPYIEDLNNGTSKQAPSHFVEAIAIQYGRPIGSIVTVSRNNP